MRSPFAARRARRELEEAVAKSTEQQRMEAVLHHEDRMAAALDAKDLVLPPDVFMEEQLRTVREDLHAPWGSVSLVGDKQWTVAADGFSPLMKKALMIPMGLPPSMSMCRWVVASGEPIREKNAHDHPLLGQCIMARKEKVKGYLGAPIFFEGQSVGAFAIQDSDEREWTDAEEARVVAGASAVGAALARRQA